MSARRFFAEPGSIRGGEARLAAAERDHAVKVLRLAAGDEVVLFDGGGHEYPGRILECGAMDIRVRVGEPRACAGDPAVRVTLLQALPRLSRFEWLVEKATEAGVSGVVPVLAQRSPPEARRARGRLERWCAIARESCRQCGRARLPELHEPLSSREAWDAWSKSAQPRAVLEPGAVEGLAQWLRRRSADERASGEWVLAVGPEGGWDDHELESARNAGFEAVALGARVLRSETAGLVAVVAALMASGELGATPGVDRSGVDRSG
jgi:16S rRNA (uracil1498-N3)-methyltransferase